MPAQKITITFTINFDPSPGSYGPSSITKTDTILYDETKKLYLTIPSTLPFLRYSTFLGWSTSSSASTPTYYAGQQVNVTCSNSNPTYVWNLYAVYEYTRVMITYNDNGGSGGPSYTYVNKGVATAISSTVPTRSGYTFSNWKYVLSDGTVKYCRAGGSVVLTEDVTFVAQWKKRGSTFDSFPSSALMDGATQYTITLSKSIFAHHHTIKIKLGNREQEQTNVDSSLTFTIPLAWNNALPNRTFYDGTVYLTTYDSSGNQLGDVVERSLRLDVPSDVKPTLTCTTSPSGNSTVASWGVYIQDYSSVKFTISASGVYSSTVKSIEISGNGYSYSNQYDSSSISLNATTDVIQSSGSKKFIIKVVDSRGRSYSVARTVNFIAYSKPALNLVSYRSDSQGVEDEFEGAYITAKVTSVNVTYPSSNTYTILLKQKIYKTSSWTTLSSSAQLNVNYSFQANISKSYVIYARITDALGSSTEQEFIANSIIGGFSIGLNNDRARFGGAVRQQGLEVDWYSRFHDNVVIDGDLSVDGKIGHIAERANHIPTASSLSSGSWSTKAQISIAAGIYIVEYGASFGSNSSGLRKIALSTSQDSSSVVSRGSANVASAVSGNSTYVNATTIITLDSATVLYLNCYQNSGSSLDVTPWIRSARIR